MMILSKPAFSSPSFFYINIEYRITCEIPMDLLDSIYREHLQILDSQSKIRLHLIQINKKSARLICSSDEDFGKEKQNEVKNLIIDISQRVFSNFDPKIKTPIGIQWELI